MQEIINKHKRDYPYSTIQDTIKLIYQSVLGNNHLIDNETQVYQRIKQECQLLKHKDYTIEDIGKDYVRLHLFNGDEADIKTITQLFLLSAKKHLDYSILINCLNEYKQTDKKHQQYIEDYIEKGCPMMSHSEIYREHYQPHYRIIRKDLVQYYPLFKRINKAVINKEELIIGIDGMCGSGKSTLSLLLNQVFDINLFHLDDFFLQSYQRTQQRYNTPGENVDHERFLEEVLIPLHNKQNVLYRQFDCSSMSISHTPIIKTYKPISVIEGTYIMHPDLRPYIDYSVVLYIDTHLQLKRLKERNNEFIYNKFIQEWIPLETLYFNYYNIKDLCHLFINISEE